MTSGGGFLFSDDDAPHMDGTRAIVLALLLCLAPLGVISAGAMQTQQNATMTVVPQDGSAEYLAPSADRVDRSGLGTASIDVAGAVGANVGEVRSTYYRVSFQRSYREAETSSERRSIVTNGTERVGERVDELERQERRAVERYRDGEIGQRELVRKLTVVDQESRALESTVDWLETRADNLGMYEAENELALHRARLRPLQGPVRSNAESAISGQADARVYVAVSSDGLVLATIEETDGEATYLREAYDPSARTDDFDQQSGSGLSAAEERLRELYPWVTNNSTPTAAPIGPDGARLWRFTYAHPQGNLETYLDVETNRVLLEHQYKEPDNVPTTTDETVEGDLRLVLNRTNAGGPLGVTLYDDDSDDPVDATVEVDDESVGSTDGDRLWTVAPRGETTINATYGGQTVSYRTTFE